MQERTSAIAEVLVRQRDTKDNDKGGQREKKLESKQTEKRAAFSTCISCVCKLLVLVVPCVALWFCHQRFVATSELF
jgi:hypothetical protein